jgi:uncharacterized membrane protein
VYPFALLPRLYGQKEVAAMFPRSGAGYEYWWIFPVIMIVMMVLCFFMMRGRIGPMMCRPGPRGDGSGEGCASESALAILNKRFACGEIGKDEFDEKRNIIIRRD